MGWMDFQLSLIIESRATVGQRELQSKLKRVKGRYWRSRQCCCSIASIICKCSIRSRLFMQIRENKKKGLRIRFAISTTVSVVLFMKYPDTLLTWAVLTRTALLALSAVEG